MYKDISKNETFSVVRLVEMRIGNRIKRALKRGREKQKRIGPGAKGTWLLQVERSVTAEDVKGAQDSLRTLEVEREVLSHVIQRLYQAEADGRINKSERDRLAGSYKERIAQVKGAISRSRSIVALHELERTRSDLVKLLNNHLSDLNMKIGKLTSRLNIKPGPAPKSKKKKRKRGKRRKRKTPEKNKAEERIQKIRAEVDKTLERLGQIEIEA